MEFEVITRGLIDMTVGHAMVEIVTGNYHSIFDPVVHVCRLCNVYTEVSQFRRGDVIPLVHPGLVCPKGHLMTLPDLLVVIDQHDNSRFRTIVPAEREVVRAGDLGMGQALTLLTVAKAVVDGTGDLASLSEAVEAAPEPIRSLRTGTKVTRDQWIAIASVLVALMTALVPLIANNGPAEPTIIQIHLDETRAKNDNDEDAHESNSDPGTSDGVIDAPMQRPTEVAGDSKASHGDDGSDDERHQ